LPFITTSAGGQQTQNTDELYNPERSLGTAKQNQLRIRGTRVSHSRVGVAKVLNTYLVRYSLVAFDRRLGIDSIKPLWGNRHALDIEADRVSMSVADCVVSDSIRRASAFERY
jgi:hypothetical protein